MITSGSKGSTEFRNYPDVSLNADPNTGYTIFITYQGALYYTQVGGTSAASPLWAAFLTLVNDYRYSVLNKGSLGLINPALYALGLSNEYNYLFHDIKDNSTNGFYPAVKGYDLATGWGSFRGNSLFYGLGGCEAEIATYYPKQIQRLQ